MNECEQTTNNSLIQRKNFLLLSFVTVDIRKKLPYVIIPSQKKNKKKTRFNRYFDMEIYYKGEREAIMLIM